MRVVLVEKSQPGSPLASSTDAFVRGRLEHGLDLDLEPALDEVPSSGTIAIGVAIVAAYRCEQSRLIRLMCEARADTASAFAARTISSRRPCLDRDQRTSEHRSSARARDAIFQRHVGRSFAGTTFQESADPRDRTPVARVSIREREAVADSAHLDGEVIDGNAAWQR